jgi:hypothetical protein
MAHDVFISHAHRDKKIAGEICEKLELARLKCWIAPRDISVREDWTEATRKAIEASRLMVLVFTDNANAAPHIEREIAHAFYTGKTIVAFRLTEALPRRDFLFYLGDACWLDASNSPPERHLEALTTRIENVTSRNATITIASPNISSSGGALQIPHSATQGVFKSVAIVGSVAALLFALWFALHQEERDPSMTDINLRSRHSAPSTSLDSTPSGEGAKLESTPRYTFSRLGLWVPVNPSPTPFIQREAQDTAALTPATQSVHATPSPSSGLDPKAGNLPDVLPTPSGLTVKPAQGGRAQVVDRQAGHRAKSRARRRTARTEGSDGFRLARIKSWLSGLFQ